MFINGMVLIGCDVDGIKSARENRKIKVKIFGCRPIYKQALKIFKNEQY